MPKNLNKLYELFEKALCSSDAQLMKVLLKFKKEDYLTLPIIFDLITNKKFNALENLYVKGIPFTYLDTSGANALHVACGVGGSLEAVKLLSKKGIFNNINAKTDEGETPFLLAVMYNHQDIVKYFLSNFNPDLSIKTIYGETTFSLAKKAGNFKIIALLEKANKSESKK